MEIYDLPEPVCKTEGGFWARSFFVLGLVLPERTLRLYASRVAVRSNGCWVWTAGKNSAGYGNIRLDHKYILAHRLFYELFVGPITQTDVCHTCDNPSCVRPSHLFQGTRLDNMQDMSRKGRHWKHKTMRGNKSEKQED